MEFMPAESGSYALALELGLCQDTSACYNYTYLGIDEFSNDKIGIKPNPTNGKIYINPGNDPGRATISITDIMGRIIAEYSYSEKESIVLYLEGQPGIYFISIKTEAGKYIFRVVKE